MRESQTNSPDQVTLNYLSSRTSIKSYAVQVSGSIVQAHFGAKLVKNTSQTWKNNAREEVHAAHLDNQETSLSFKHLL